MRPWPRWRSRRCPGTPMGIYVHLPFCRKRCHFCYFRVYTGRDAKNDRVRAYVDAVLDELEIYARSPLDCRPPAALRLLRRRHAFVPFPRASSHISSTA